jgi:hypothetical protein
MSQIEVAYMKFGGWAWRCWTCDRNHFGYGEDREAADADARAHMRRTHPFVPSPATTQEDR